MTLASSRTVHLRNHPIIEDTANQPPLMVWNELTPDAHDGTVDTPQNSAAFTPRSGTLVLVCTGWGTDYTNPSATVVDSAGTAYTSLVKRDTKNTCEIWSHYYATSPGSIHLTITSTGAVHGGVASIRSLINAAPVQPGAISANGDAHQNTALTLSRNNVVYGISTNWNNSNGFGAILSSSQELAQYGLTDGYDSFGVYTSRTLGLNSYGYTNTNAGIAVAVEILHR
ncbi:hypothetical protein EON76_02730 [bacterium]|nr:MAG: hypothetical protein EON76_02730 [bacterium]